MDDFLGFCPFFLKEDYLIPPETVFAPLFFLAGLSAVLCAILGHTGSFLGLSVRVLSLPVSVIQTEMARSCDLVSFPLPLSITIDSICWASLVQGYGTGTSVDPVLYSCDTEMVAILTEYLRKMDLRLPVQDHGTSKCQRWDSNPGLYRMLINHSDQRTERHHGTNGHYLL